ncbi:hypothetical protein [Euzebya rosea]|uniref:hypothetical protein n=1 Tax=Euzebya rosea TaxID=2052804 RepID=UPI001300AE86|nr:hypothetical protein [Euzebya rosea]
MTQCGDWRDQLATTWLGMGCSQTSDRPNEYLLDLPMFRADGDGLTVLLAEYGERVMITDLSETAAYLRDHGRAFSTYSMNLATKPWGVEVNSDMALTVRGLTNDVGALLLDLASAMLAAGSHHRTRAAVDDDLTFDEQVARFIERSMPDATVKRRPSLSLSEEWTYRPSLTVTPNGHTAAVQTLPAGGSTSLYVSEAYRTLLRVREHPTITSTLAVLAGDKEEWPAREVRDLAEVARVVSWSDRRYLPSLISRRSVDVGAPGLL